MSILRINQHPTGAPNRYRVDVSAEVPNFQPPSFSRDIEFVLSPQEENASAGILKTFFNSMRNRHRPSPDGSKH